MLLFWLSVIRIVFTNTFADKSTFHQTIGLLSGCALQRWHDSVAEEESSSKSDDWPSILSKANMSNLRGNKGLVVSD